MIDKINSLIGKPYNATTYHCWNLVKELQPSAPDIDVIASKTTAVRYMNDKHYDNWIITQSPKDLDICLLGTKEDVYQHARIFFNGMIIHADIPMVRAEKLDIIYKTYPYIRFYTKAS